MKVSFATKPKEVAAIILAGGEGARLRRFAPLTPTRSRWPRSVCPLGL
jgi:hypothetical protein